MNTLNQGSGIGLTRRDFLKMTGMATAAFLIPGILAKLYAANPGVKSMTTASQNQFVTDVLVIGGGMAGVFAAITAKEQGLNVTLVDKGTVGRSGATPWANTFAVFDEAQGHNREEWIAGVRSSSEYVNNLDWLDQMLDESKDRWDDIVSWGLTREDVRHPSLVLREKLLESGVKLVERTMITTLLTQDNNENGHVVGAMGFALDSEEAVVILAKSTIMCAGAGSFKAPGFPIHCLTSDGDAMAYRIGARITGKEWIDFHWTQAENPASCWTQWSRMWDTGVGQTNQVFTAGMTLDSAFAIHTGETSVNTSGGPPEGEGGTPPAGKGGTPPDGESGGGPPPGQSSGEQVLGAATGLGIHKAEGIWPTSMQGASDIPGLFAAGDGLGSMLCGSSYVGLGFSLSGSAVQGVAAGRGAVAYAQQADEPTLSEDAIASLQEAMFAPRERESGFSPAWVTQVLQNTMFPYFVLMVKHEDRLQAALSTITFLRENMAPRLIAKDAHELRLAHETENMLLNAEMKLRASLFRTESRGTHYREDYPARNDDEWLAWVLLQKGSDGQMTVTKEAIPDDWKPDLSIPYKERYTNRFPGELEFLGLA
ncbi:Succinate dehydrogenase flavoprotein subunit [Methanosarcina lacustris Z-7289]|uniref:Succinate dehydrogenase flavoprotein subunit n=1 Tax=Methanosarcina lacustris Z-7289 TaxID=1434111 RepID=A0A0E3S2G9_9EURY|nr:FAD-binding protein [Methanosarcina lacustris]AKB74994.1 Succinate dehydrogenase flavoprotein subunit [Methanosarcina lacustris Z-7289]